MTTAEDREPAVGTRVLDVYGWVWERQPEGYWLRLAAPDGDPESWTKVAGNYGPVRIVGKLERDVSERPDDSTR